MCILASPSCLLFHLWAPHWLNLGQVGAKETPVILSTGQPPAWGWAAGVVPCKVLSTCSEVWVKAS